MNTTQEQRKLIEIECLECEYEAKKLDTKIVTYTQGVVEVCSLTCALREKWKFAKLWKLHCVYVSQRHYTDQKFF